MKILSLEAPDGKKVRRFQYTAIDDATRIRGLRIYSRHNQANAVNFIDYVLERFPFRIYTVRTDNGHEFQAQFHWHVEDKGFPFVFAGEGLPIIQEYFKGQGECLFVDREWLRKYMLGYRIGLSQCFGALQMSLASTLLPGTYADKLVIAWRRLGRVD